METADKSKPKAPRRLLSIAEMMDRGRAEPPPPGIVEQPRGIRCPKCGSPSVVTATRHAPGITMRYRRCCLPSCATHFRTEEK